MREGSYRKSWLKGRKESMCILYGEATEPECALTSWEQELTGLGRSGPQMAKVLSLDKDND